MQDAFFVMLSSVFLANAQLYPCLSTARQRKLLAKIHSFELDSLP